MNITFHIPGDTLLHPEMAVEELGGGKSVGLENGLESRNHIRCREEIEEKTSDWLSVLKPEASQLLGLQILLLWISCPVKCLRYVAGIGESDSLLKLLYYRPNVFIGSLFWWHIFYLWHRGHVFCGQRPGGQNRSYDLCLPKVQTIKINKKISLNTEWYLYWNIIIIQGWQNVHSTNLGPPEILRSMTPYVFYRSILVRTNWSMNLEKIIHISVNEKIYIFIWFWLLFLGFLSSLVIVYRIVIVFSPYIRAFVLRLRYRLKLNIIKIRGEGNRH